jgi:hypothetical protein
MWNPFQRLSSPNDGPNEPSRSNVGDRLAHFEQRQRQLWRLTYGLLALLTVAYVAASWDALRSIAQRYEALLIGVVVVVTLFMVYAWKRNQEISELRGLVRGIEQRHTSPPSDHMPPSRKGTPAFAHISRTNR